MEASVSLPVYKRRASLFYDDEERKTKKNNKIKKINKNITSTFYSQQKKLQ